jgi:hypothetical protein
MRDSIGEEMAGALLRFIEIQFSVRDSRLIIVGYELRFRSRATNAITTVGRGALPGMFDTAQLFRVDLDDITRSLVLLALHWLGRPLQVGQTCRPARIKTRLTVVFDSARCSAMRACVIRFSSSSSIGGATGSSMARRLIFGRGGAFGHSNLALGERASEPTCT